MVVVICSQLHMIRIATLPSALMTDDKTFWNLAVR